MLQIRDLVTGLAPHFSCDYCQESISDIREGLYLWRQKKLVPLGEPDLPGPLLLESGRIYTLHKDCARAFEAAHGGRHFDWPWAELIDLLILLAHNGGLSIDDLQRRQADSLRGTPPPAKSSPMGWKERLMAIISKKKGEGK